MSYSIFLIKKFSGEQCNEFWVSGYSINQAFEIVGRWNAVDNRKWEVRAKQ